MLICSKLFLPFYLVLRCCVLLLIAHFLSLQVEDMHSGESASNMETVSLRGSQ